MAKQDEKMQSGPLLQQHSSDLTEEAGKNQCEKLRRRRRDDDCTPENGKPVPGQTSTPDVCRKNTTIKP